MKCDKCKRIITKEDDYGGAYVYWSDKYYHLICYNEYNREKMQSITDTILDGMERNRESNTHVQFIVEHSFMCDECDKVFFAQDGNNEYFTFYYKDIKLAYDNHVKAGHEGLIRNNGRWEPKI